MNKNDLRKANFKTKKDLYNILKKNECHTIRKLNVEKEVLDKFFQYSENFDKHFNFFEKFVLKYTQKNEIEEVKEFINNDNKEFIFRLAKRIYRKIDYIINNCDKIILLENKSQYLILNNKNHFYKTDFFVKDNKIISKDNLVIYDVFIKDFIY